MAEHPGNLLAVGVDGTTRWVDNSYGGIKAGLDGAMLDVVGLSGANGALFVDDEAMFKRLGFNVPASLLAGVAIYGPVVLCGPTDADGDTMLAPERYSHALAQMGHVWHNVVRDAELKGQVVIPVADDSSLPPPVVEFLSEEAFDRWLGGQE